MLVSVFTSIQVLPRRDNKWCILKRTSPSIDVVIPAVARDHTALRNVKKLFSIRRETNRIRVLITAKDTTTLKGVR